MAATDGILRSVWPPPLNGEDISALAAAPLQVETPPSDADEAKPASPPRTVARLVDQVLVTVHALETNAPRTTPMRPFTSLRARMDARWAEKIVVDHMMPAALEQYRRLAAVLLDAQRAKGLKVVMIASATAGEGRTLTATNLALTLSESYQKHVLLVDADIRRPSIDGVFGLESSTPGLSDGLASVGSLTLAIRHVSSHLTLLPAGRPTRGPVAGLASPRMRSVLGEARQRFDWVILDTPPVMLLPDAHLLASMVDGVVLVIRAGSTPHALMTRAAEAIGRPRIVGAVLNCAQQPLVAPRTICRKRAGIHLR
jgi:capsular exopolysaccharide synthesis family protein